MAQAQTKTVITPKIRILQRPKNDHEKSKGQIPGPTTSIEAQNNMADGPKHEKRTNAIKCWSKFWKRKPWILYYFWRSKAGHEYGDSGRLAFTCPQHVNNPWDEIDFLKQQLQASHHHQNELYWKLVAANKRASDYQSQLNQLHAQMKGHHLISRTPRPITGLFGK